MRMTRGASAAISTSCVIRTTVWPLSSRELLEQGHDFFAGGGVEVSGWLVGEQDVRVVCEGPRDRHSLLLAAGELRRKVVGSSGEPDRLEELVDSGAAGVAVESARGHRHLDVLPRGQRRDEVELLEDEPDRGPPQPGQIGVAQPSQGRARRSPRRSSGDRARRAAAASSSLPDPLGPTMAMNSPASISRLTPSTALTPVAPSP